MMEIYLDIDDNGYIISPKDKVYGNVVLKLKKERDNIKIGDNFLLEWNGLNISAYAWGSARGEMHRTRLEMFNTLLVILFIIPIT